MSLIERNQDIAILRADGAGVVVGLVDTAHGQAEIVDDAAQFVPRNCAADTLLDLVEQLRRFFYAGAHLCAHVHLDLPGIDGGEEIPAQEWHQGKR